MKVSFKKIEINPNLPVLLSGFGKERLATSIHDSIYARVFLFKNKNTEILWVQMDLVGIDEYFYNLLSTKTGLSKENILLSTTHTHSGPGGTLNTTNGLLKGMGSVFGGEHNPAYYESITDKLNDAYKECKDSLEDCTLTIYQGQVNGLGTERHDINLECDQDALLLEVKTSNKKAMLVRLACHPTVLNADNIIVSADFPSEIEPHFPEYEMVGYVNGSCGDMSTRFTRQSFGFDEIKRYGDLVSKQLKEILKNEGKVIQNLEIHQKYFTMKFRSTDPMDVALKKLEDAKKAVEKAKAEQVSPQELRVIQSFLEGAQNNLLASMSFGNKESLDILVSYLKLDDFNIIFTPFELFSKLSNPYKQYNLEFIGYTNDYILYLPDITAFEKQFYEASSCMFAQGEGEKLMNEIYNWIK